MASSTYNTVLKCGTSAELVAKLCPITEYPDMGGAPEMLDVTTLDDDIEVSIPGIQRAGEMEFGAIYSDADFEAVNTAANTPSYYALEFANGTKYTWQGQHTVYEVGAGTNSPRTMRIVIARSSKIAWTKAI